MPARVESEASKTAKDVSIFALAAVIAIVIIIIVSVMLIVRALRGIVDKAEKSTSIPYECTAWLKLRQQDYLSAKENGGGAVSRTTCEAAGRAINDAEARRACPTKNGWREAYMKMQGCA